MTISNTMLHRLPPMYAPTLSEQINFKVLAPAREFVAEVLDDTAYLMKGWGKGHEKTLKALLAIMSCGIYIRDHLLNPVVSTAKIVWVSATQATLKSSTELFGAFHIFGSASKWYNETEKSPTHQKWSLRFLAISDTFEACVYLQKVRILAVTAFTDNVVYRSVQPALSVAFAFIANVAAKTGCQRFFNATVSFIGKVTIVHAKNYTQVIGVILGLIEISRIIRNASSPDAKKTSSLLKVGSDVGKIGLITFSGGLGFLAGYTATLAFTLWCLTSTLIPVVKIVFDYHMTKRDTAAKEAAAQAAKDTAQNTVKESAQKA